MRDFAKRVLEVHGMEAAILFYPKAHMVMRQKKSRAVPFQSQGHQIRLAHRVVNVLDSVVSS